MVLLIFQQYQNIFSSRRGHYVLCSRRNLISTRAENDVLFGCLAVTSLGMLSDNTFSNAGKFEFEDSTDTTWTGNDIVGDGCIDDDQNDKADFASGSDAIPICED